MKAGNSAHFGTSKAALKYKLHQQHIADGAPCDGQQHLALPEVEQNNNCNRKQLRDAVISGKNSDIFQAIDDQQAEYCGRKDFSQILDVFRSRLARGEKQEWQKAGCHGS